ncbi:hypothetical protein BG006_003010 [Podila minutissima]|uniref:ATP-binding cassette transporter n=1 Tax=Podila minutissima TaxID=64525 RepID=A0A9P5SMJ3_9FUNG|nr:hypothetical protein BG006_003010 [Podila minutissima]
MNFTLEAIQASLPVAYSVASAVALIHLARKPVHLDQYEAIRDDNDDEPAPEDNNNVDVEHTFTTSGGVSPSPSTSTVIDHAQAQYQQQRTSGMAVNLARVGLTAGQLGLDFFSIVLFYSTSNNRYNNTESDRLSTLAEISHALSWLYALALTLVHVIRPAISHQFKIRLQLDIFYVLQIVLSSIHLCNTNIFTSPVSDWSLWLKLDVATWITGMLLIWVSLLTQPYRPLTPPKKHVPGQVPRQDSSEYSSSLYARLTFSWVNPLVYLRYKRTIESTDLPHLEVSDFSWYSIRRHDLVKLTKKGTFTRTLIETLKGEIFVQFLWAMPWCVFVNISPYCLNKIIQYIECKECGAPTAVNYLYVFGLLLASLGDSLCMQAVCHKGRRIYFHTASICNGEVFAKTLRRKDIASSDHKDDNDNLDKKEDDKEGSLNIANLVAVDIRKMEDPISYFFFLYSYPIQFLFASYQLYRLLGYAAVVGIGFMVATYPIPAKLYSMIMDIFKEIMSTKDERMDALNEMLSAIRIVKFFGWESKFQEKITAAREKELERTRASYKQIVLAELVWIIMPILNIVVVLLSYTKLFGHDISASKVFTTLALFNIVRNAVNNLPWSVKNTMQAVVSLKRINRFLQEEELVKDTVVTKIDNKAQASSFPTIGFRNATFVWPNKENDTVTTKVAEMKLSWIQKVKARFVKKTAPVATQEPIAEPEAVQERFKLKDINLEFPIGKLSVIVGPTGSGKSALLLALLGELERVEGNMYLPRLDYGPSASKNRGSGIAYVAQTAWLQNSTIRDNILFGREFDQDRYDAVVEGCALTTDFEILEAGDATEIGEQGITLSGGQKQRVSLARAVYSAANVLLLDDCLSAVDSHTGKHLFETLTGPLLYGRTVLMATHQVQLIMSAASLVVVLEKGTVLGSGSPEEVINNGWVDNVVFSQPPSGDDSEVSTLQDEEGAQKTKKAPTKKASTKLTVDEKKAEGAVAWNVYRTYLNSSGGWAFWLCIIGLFLIRETLNISQNAWLAIWANRASEAVGSFAIRTFNAAMPEPVALSFRSAFVPHQGEHGAFTVALFGKGTPDSVNVEYYLGVYILLSVCTVILSASSSLCTILGGLKASRAMHEQLLHKITHAKVRFYDTTPLGRIINRFSSDMSSVDEDVSMGIYYLFSSVVTLVGIIIIISVNMPAFLIPAVFIVAIYIVIGLLYVPISRDLKRINSNSRSPILNHFNETLNGLATIRAYGFERQFMTKNLDNLDDNNRSFFLLWSTNRWLHWRVDVTGASVSFITGILVLQSWGKIEPGWAALSLTYSLMFTTTIVWVIRMYATNEMNLNSVERLTEYMELEEEPPAVIEGSRPPAHWPHAGEIVVDHLVMKYAPDTPAVIKDVSFRIKAGEKIGVVGRTGSGKSTFAISLFRFMEPTSGSITIDGIDITKIGLHDLRTNLTIIPQDPILFKGTLRSNLDPFGEREDRDLWEALRRSHLIPSSSAPSKRTSLDMTPASSSSSSLATERNKTPAGSIKSSVTAESEIVDSSKVTLDTPVKANGSNFSQGQRQLIALARALVRQSKIIVMDEATASVDFETDLKIQGTIRQEMGASTILTIAHRIRTIADFDRVLVMNAGEVAEFDKPLTLMQREGSIFRSMCERSSEFDALLAIAEEKERRDSERAY